MSYHFFSCRSIGGGPDTTGDTAKKWGKLSIADALKNARGMPRIIKAGGGGGGVKRPPTHSSSQEQDIPTSLSRVSSKREKYLKVAKEPQKIMNNIEYGVFFDAAILSGSE
jgi:hypothetical protein